MKMNLKTKADIQRYSNKRYIIKPESVADHLWYMTEIALRLNQKINFNIKEVIYRIMIHDMEEFVTLDIPRDVKHSSREYKEMTDDVAFKILRKENICTPSVLTDAITAKCHDSIEGALVHFIDAYQAYLKLYDEVYVLGNKSLEGELNNECVPYLQEVVEEVSKDFPELEYLSTLI